jgi:hypothetical protein
MFELLEEVLSHLDKGKLSVNPAKCVLFCSKVEFLGSEISRDGIRVLPTNIDSIQRLKVPQNPKDLKSFLGACQFVGNHCENYSEWKRNLTPLLCKGVPFVWTEAQMWSWTRIKSALINPPVLQFVRLELPVIIECDASYHSVGTVVFQEIILSNGKPSRSIIAYLSKAFSKPQRKWTIYKKELFAAYWSVKKCCYLLGMSRGVL